jgi:gas vesicle protein
MYRIFTILPASSGLPFDRTKKELFKMREDREQEASATTKLTYLLIGGGIGAIVALLFAPKSGLELRGDIADATRKGIEKGKETAALVGERAGEYYEVTRDKAGELYATAQEKAGEFTEKAKEAAARSTNPFSAALEAGKQAYGEEKRRTESSVISEGRPNYPVENKGLKPATATTKEKTEGDGIGGTGSSSGGTGIEG